MHVRIRRMKAATLPAITAMFLSLGSIATTVDSAASHPPNIVLITLDTTRADRLGCYGGNVSTPALDALARAGVRFEQVQSPAPLTVPAHASLLTGLVPRRHGARDNALYPLPANVPVLAELLATHGYDTAAFVSSVVLDRRAGLARGFSHYDDRVRIGRREAFNYEERAATQTNDAVFRRLGELTAPFFLWVHYFDPHLPYVPPPPFGERYAGRPYDGEIAFMDQALGALVNRTRARFPDALIVVAGDHGESLGEHGERAHGVFLYQGTQRVPLILAGAGVPSDRVVRTRVGLVDVMPTILALSGIDSPPGLDGQSLAPLFGKKKNWKGRAYEMESLFPWLAYDWAPLRGWVAGDLVAIESPKREFYDLTSDPLQEKNLGPTHARARPMFKALGRLAGAELPPAGSGDAERRMKLASLGYASARPDDGAVSSIDPKDAIRWLQVLDAARAAVQLGRPGEAVAPLQRLLEKNPGNIPARLTLVAAQLAAGNATAAVASARKAIEQNPDDDLVRFNLANALSAEKTTRPQAESEAREQYEHALRLNPRRVGAYLNYAAMLADAGEIQAARALLERAEDAGLDGPDLASRRGALELILGQRETAIRYFEHALRLDPSAQDAEDALQRLRGRDRP